MDWISIARWMVIGPAALQLAAVLLVLTATANLSSLAQARNIAIAAIACMLAGIALRLGFSHFHGGHLAYANMVIVGTLMISPLRTRPQILLLLLTLTVAVGAALLTGVTGRYAPEVSFILVSPIYTGAFGIFLSQWLFKQYRARHLTQIHLSRSQSGSTIRKLISVNKR